MVSICGLITWLGRRGCEYELALIQQTSKISGALDPFRKPNALGYLTRRMPRPLEIVLTPVLASVTSWGGGPGKVGEFVIWLAVGSEFVQAHGS